jgi:hypothetical protein
MHHFGPHMLRGVGLFVLVVQQPAVARTADTPTVQRAYTRFQCPDHNSAPPKSVSPQFVDHTRVQVRSEHPSSPGASSGGAAAARFAHG